MLPEIHFSVVVISSVWLWSFQFFNLFIVFRDLAYFHFLLTSPPIFILFSLSLHPGEQVHSDGVTEPWNLSFSRHVSCLPYSNTRTRLPMQTTIFFYHFFHFPLSFTLSFTPGLIKDLENNVQSWLFYWEDYRNSNASGMENVSRVSLATTEFFVCTPMHVYVCAVSAAYVSDHIYIFNVSDWIMYEPCGLEGAHTHFPPTQKAQLNTEPQKKFKLNALF